MAEHDVRARRLVIAVPYCQVVVADAQARSATTATGLDRGISTYLSDDDRTV
jgi:hypothetical protein